MRVNWLRERPVALWLLRSVLAGLLAAVVVRGISFVPVQWPQRVFGVDVHAVWAAIDCLAVGVGAAAAAGANVPAVGAVTRRDPLAGGAIGGIVSGIATFALTGVIVWLSATAIALVALLGVAIALRLCTRWTYRRELVAIIGIVAAIAATVVLLPRIEREFERSYPSAGVDEFDLVDS